MNVDGIEQIDVKSLKEQLDKNLDFTLLDVRTSEEYDIANIQGLNIPLQELKERFTELPKERDIVVHCHHGGRSQQAAVFLKAKGFKSVKNLSGGIDAWSRLIDDSITRY